MLKHQMKEAREYFVHKVNSPLSKAIIILARRYPEPTREGEGKVLHPNSLRLLDMRDEFFTKWDFGGKSNLLIRALFKIAIVKYEESPAWRNMLDWLLMTILASDWKPFNLSRQMRCWKGGIDA